jgi:hypothetical protein
MAPSIPTFRPVFTATRIAAAVAIVSMASSLVLLMYAPADAASATNVACAAAPLSGLR